MLFLFSSNILYFFWCPASLIFCDSTMVFGLILSWILFDNHYLCGVLNLWCMPFISSFWKTLDTLICWTRTYMYILDAVVSQHCSHFSCSLFGWYKKLIIIINSVWNLLKEIDGKKYEISVVACIVICMGFLFPSKI